MTTFLRFLNHYPSHIWLWALAGRLDAYLWLWIALNALYLARGWLGLVLRFGRSLIAMRSRVALLRADAPRAPGRAPRTR